MGKVTYSPGIEYVSGALTKAQKKNGHKCGDYLIGTHRTAPTENPDCTRIYIRKGVSYERTSPLSDDEINARNRFKAVSQAVALRRKDLQHITTDQENFLIQKNAVGGKKTMTAYLWKICGDIYDAQQH